MGNATKPQNSNLSQASTSQGRSQAAADLKLYNTATHEVSAFTSIVPGKVGIYVCGATVQSSPHIGHIRAAVAFDIVRRWLQKLGYEVTFIRNVTDIDDKILDKAAAAGQQWWARAYYYEREFTRAYDTLGVLPPTYEPRATGHIGDMVDLIQRLIDRGHAYVITDENGKPTGNVFFDVASWPHYGELTHQKQSAGETYDEASAITDSMGPSVDQSGDDKYNPVDPADYDPAKHDPRDFALWKASKPSDPETARWKTPFGTGRPGWHIECSAMSHRYLDGMFDIHGGGLDLRFPHHENEMAQTRAAGYESANVWMHSAWVTAKGEKMSKSLGNGLSVPSVLAQNSAWVVRYALGGVQYRSMLEWSDQTLAEANAAYKRIMNFINGAGRALKKENRLSETLTGIEDNGQPNNSDFENINADALSKDFTAAMNNDINVSGALAAIFVDIKKGNSLSGYLSNIKATRKLLAEKTDQPEAVEKELLSQMAYIVSELGKTEPQLSGKQLREKVSRVFDQPAKEILRQHTGKDSMPARLPNNLYYIFYDTVYPQESTDVTSLGDLQRAEERKLGETLISVRAMLDTLGLDPLAEPWNAAASTGGANTQSTDAQAEHRLLNQLIAHQLDARNAARKAKNFELADKIRDGLGELGITIEDKPSGSTWSLK
ncbi:cysteine--tRNA ligase [Bifidobacterium sp. ESL0764]|uniref:cysteine--tRNA ligase n=1 Tax=Bifidobacterium sp. ESL0764 TaxID=2983228 RepID=UPI0023F7D145|nr:cysteine--tRNA ligase [Bifidobacterium sp. ESL0764]WEV66057.1 cysteine--tRNA ligase [Bifidobacterium sp. ESL0764]